MVIGRLVKITLITLLLFLILGCGREKSRSDYELGKDFFLASDYEQAMMRLENWVQKSKNPNLTESHAMLAVIYHDRANREAEFDAEVTKLKEIGEPGMAAVLKLMENRTIADRLGKTINDILVKGGNLSVGPLLKDLKNTNWRLKVNARDMLIELGKTAADSVIPVLNDPDPYNRVMAIEILSKIGGEKVISLLEQKLNDPDKFIQVSAATALHSMGKANPTQIILSALDDTNVDVRRIAAKAAMETLEDPPLDKMVKLLKDPDPDIRNYATMTVGKFRYAEAVPALIKEIRTDTSDQVKSSAKKALESIGAPSVEPLIKVLPETKDMELIIRIAQILSTIGDKRAIEPLENVYKKDNRPFLKNEVAKALNKID